MNAPIMLMPGVRRRQVLPRPIRVLVRSFPRVPSAAIVAVALNLLLRKKLPAAVFDRLGERPFSIEVTDMGLVMSFRYSGARFVPVPPAPLDAPRFRVNASDFACLAAPEGDPDVRWPGDRLVTGDPAITPDVCRTLAEIDVAHARRILRRAARRIDRAHAD